MQTCPHRAHNEYINIGDPSLMIQNESNPAGLGRASNSEQVAGRPVLKISDWSASSLLAL